MESGFLVAFGKELPSRNQHRHFIQNINILLAFLCFLFIIIQTEYQFDLIIFYTPLQQNFSIFIVYVNPLSLRKSSTRGKHTYFPLIQSTLFSVKVRIKITITLFTASVRSYCLYIFICSWNREQRCFLCIFCDLN